MAGHKKGVRKMSEQKKENSYSEYYIINFKIFDKDNKKKQYDYLSFFKTISKYKDKIDVTKTYSALIENITFYHKDTVVNGKIVYGSNIRKLYDITIKDELSKDELTDFEDKLANSKKIEFVFIPECHRMVVKNNISINTTKKIMDVIYLEYIKREKLENLEYHCIIEQSNDNLQKLLAKDIKKLSIHFSGTNSDNVSDEFARLFDDDTKESGAKQVELSYSSENKKDSFLNITDKMKAISKLAIQNGSVDIIAVEAGEKHKYSTTDIPELIKISDRGSNIELKTEAIRDIISGRYPRNRNE